MKKKLLIALFATAMITLAACGKKEPAETKTETSTDTVAEVAAEPELSPERVSSGATESSTRTARM